EALLSFVRRCHGVSCRGASLPRVGGISAAEAANLRYRGWGSGRGCGEMARRMARGHYVLLIGPDREAVSGLEEALRARGIPCAHADSGASAWASLAER